MVDAIGTSAGAAAAAQPSRPTRLDDVIRAVAKELGMSTDDLSRQLRDGASLDDIAAGKGVSHDDLVATISQALQSSQTQPGSTDPSRIEQLAERIASAKGHHHHHHHHTDAGSVTASDPAAPTAAGVAGASGAATLGTRLDTLG